ncbi:MAG: DUF1287 domain-containing protein [Polyangia bacterium]
MWALLFLALAAGLPDRGIFSELDAQVSTTLPAGIDPARTSVRIDRAHQVLTLYDGGDAVKAYPIDPAGAATAFGVALREADAEELARVTRPSTAVIGGAPARSEDRDGDGIVDPLDILLGAKKLVVNRARYIERYVTLRYPGGDVPRTEGVCSDTVIRALRNAGIDLQREVHEDLLRARHAYPMVEKIDASINHRRVRTLLPWFERHLDRLGPGARFLPGDIVFFDTLPSRPGPDHLGVVSDRVGPSGFPLVINNWTEGTVDAELDLLSWVPVTHHFRMGPPSAAAAARRGRARGSLFRGAAPKAGARSRRAR